MKNPFRWMSTNAYDRFSYEAMGLLFAGIKDWNLEKFDDALPILRQFFSSSPKGSPLWIGDEDYVTKLKDMAQSFADDYGQLQRSQRASRAGPTSEEKRAIDAAKKVRAQMKYPSKLTRTLDATFAELQPKAMADIREKQRLSAEADAIDQKAFAVAKEKGDALLKEYRFSDAKDAYKEPDLKQPDRIEQQNAEVKKARVAHGLQDKHHQGIEEDALPGARAGLQWHNHRGFGDQRRR
jgi:hypothetical protein